MAYAVVKQSMMRRWGGKLTLGAAGAVLGGPLGALLGAAAGHAYDRYRKTLATVEAAYADVESPAATKNSAHEAAFIIGVVALGAKLAHGGQHLSQQAVENFRTTFGLPSQNVPLIRKMFEQALFDKHSYRPYAEQLAEIFKGRTQMLESLVSGLIRFARIEQGGLSIAVTSYLQNLAGIFGISDARFVQLLAAEGVTRGDALKATDAFAILGVTPGAPEAVVKQAYRTLLRDNHPDKLHQQALDAVAMAAANDRVAAINMAYAEIKRVRGWG